MSLSPLPAPREPDGWDAFRESLSVAELKALAILLEDAAGIKTFADENGVMLEVLMDGINEKASDSIGDNIIEIDGDMIIYDEYRKALEELIR
jgi:hypothetical protein